MNFFKRFQTQINKVLMNYSTKFHIYPSQILRVTSDFVREGKKSRHFNPTKQTKL